MLCCIYVEFHFILFQICVHLIQLFILFYIHFFFPTLINSSLLGQQYGQRIGHGVILVCEWWDSIGSGPIPRWRGKSHTDSFYYLSHSIPLDLVRVRKREWVLRKKLYTRMPILVTLYYVNEWCNKGVYYQLLLFSL